MTTEKEFVMLDVKDARLLMPKPTLNSRGFTMVGEPSKCENLEDDTCVKA